MKIPLRVGIPILTLLFLAALISGCTQTISSTPQGDMVSIAEGDEPFRPITLEEGIIKMENLLARDEDPPGKQNLTLKYFQGRGVSREGKAEQWIFGVRSDGENFFIQVESNRQVLVPWRDELPGEEIDPSEIIPPGDLITMNGPLIAQTFSIPEASIIIDVELLENIYTLTPEHSDAYRILYFNATTGRSLH